MELEKKQALIEVRRKTGAAIASCKKSLEINDWDIEAACRNIAKTDHDSKNSNEHNSYGTIALYSHQFGRIGSMIELSCESGYVAKQQDFVRLANTIAIHVAWSNPRYISRDEIDQREIEIAKDNFRDTIGSGPAWEKVGKLIITDGMVIMAMESHFYPKVCLLEQLEMKETKGRKTIGELLIEMTEKMGERIEVKRFARFKIGEE